MGTKKSTKKKETLAFADRYSAVGIKHADTKTICNGQCEGMGCVPIYKDEKDKVFKDLWNKAEKKKKSDDGWHFVKCPTCNGTGLKKK